MPIVLFPIRYMGDPVWLKRLWAISDPEGPYFHAGLAAMAEYAQYSSDLQHTTARTVILQLKCENDLLHSDTVPPSDQDQELKVVYHCLSDAEHAWHYIRQQLDASREMVDERTCAIIHLEHTNGQQDLKLERTMVIASLVQQVQVLQLQVPPAFVAPAVEPDTMLDVDEM
jgi:multidrug resistance efflux pump